MIQLSTHQSFHDLKNTGRLQRLEKHWLVRGRQLNLARIPGERRGSDSKAPGRNDHRSSLDPLRSGEAESYPPVPRTKKRPRPRFAGSVHEGEICDLMESYGIGCKSVNQSQSLGISFRCFLHRIG